MKLKWLEENIFPVLRAKHPDPNEFKKSIGAFLKQGDEDEIPVTDEAGDPVEFDRIILVKDETAPIEEPEEAPEEAPAITEEAVKRIVAEAVKTATKNLKSGKVPSVKRIANAVITGGGFRNDDEGKSGWKNFGEFARAVYNGCPQIDMGIDKRLLTKAPTSYGAEAVGADGGFLVPPDFSEEIKQYSLAGDALLSLTDQMPVTGNSMTFPADETTPWGTNGVRAYWMAEAAQATQSKPELKERTLKLNKLIALVPVTEELLSDTTTLETYLTTKTGESIQWKTNDAIVNGTGAGQPLGIANSGALVTVAKETSQTADTINATNVAKMFARIPASMLGRAVWLINNDALPQLMVMTLGNQPIWTAPSTGFVNAPGGLLLGRPIIPTQTAQTVGDLGDIYLADFGSYASISKEVQSQSSIHLFFDYDMTAFKATFRVDGQPWPQAAITPANGSNSLSPFVALAERT